MCERTAELSGKRDPRSRPHTEIPASTWHVAELQSLPPLAPVRHGLRVLGTILMADVLRDSAEEC